MAITTTNIRTGTGYSVTLDVHGGPQHVSVTHNGTHMRYVRWEDVPAGARQALRQSSQRLDEALQRDEESAQLDESLRREVGKSGHAVFARNRRGVRPALLAYLRTPEGGWPETEQAWRRLVDECSLPRTPGSGAQAARELVEAAQSVGVEGHPSRRYPANEAASR